MPDSPGVFCKQGVRGSSPLSSTGQKHNSNSRGGSTAARYRNRGRTGCRTRVRVGALPSPTAATRGAQSPGLWLGSGATEQGRTCSLGSAKTVERPASSILNLPFQDQLLPLRQRVNEGQAISVTQGEIFRGTSCVHPLPTMRVWELDVPCGWLRADQPVPAIPDRQAAAFPPGPQSAEPLDRGDLVRWPVCAAPIGRVQGSAAGRAGQGMNLSRAE